MFGSRCGVRGIGVFPPCLDGGGVFTFDRVDDVVVEAESCRMCIGIYRPVDCAEIVDDVAADENEHALLSQYRQLATRLEMPRGRAGEVDRQLRHRHVRMGEDVGKHGPCAVVDAPGCGAADRRGSTHGSQKIGDAQSHT